jgi:hypothetical protein
MLSGTNVQLSAWCFTAQARQANPLALPSLPLLLLGQAKEEI